MAVCNGHYFVSRTCVGREAYAYVFLSSWRCRACVDSVC